MIPAFIIHATRRQAPDTVVGYQTGPARSPVQRSRRTQSDGLQAKGGGKGGGDGGARAAEEARQKRIAEGASAINTSFDQQFTPEFYSGIESAYQDWANPQLEQQLEQQRRDLAFALARNGVSQSTAAADAQARLNEQLQRAQAQLADQARGYATNQRTAVENARGSLLSQNTASADPAAAAIQAQQQAQALQAMPQFSALGQLFQNVSAGLATQADLERRGQARYNTGLFNTSPTSATKIVG